MPVSPEDDVVSVRGLRLHYRRWSPVEPVVSEPIVLLHGLASSSHIWNLVAPQLAAQGYSVTALDQRGHGESEKPTSGYDFATIVADDHAALQALGIEQPVLVGHSWGAAVVLQYAVTYAGQVRSLVLVDGAINQLSARANWTRERARKDLAPPRFAGTPREAFMARVRSGPLGEQWTPELEDITLHIVQLRDDDTVAPRLDFENHLQIIDAMWDQPTFDLYRQVQCPVTLIIAEQERQGEPWEGFRQARQDGIATIKTLCPQIQIIRMPNTIHDIPLQRPDRLTEEILRTIP
ncbi:MAG TPA: alpha/beta hydrolase [Ktedonobacteraceae bacterium]|nr:alpha/beta hydrolase [Ktedonobacteraceae bacterium]